MAKLQCELTAAAEMKRKTWLQKIQEGTGVAGCIGSEAEGGDREHAEDPGGLGDWLEKERKVKREEPILERRGEFGF